MPIDPKLVPNDSPIPKGATPQAPTDTSGGVETLQRLQGVHGGLVGAASPMLPQDPVTGSIPQSDPYYLYTFTDGTQAVVNSQGQINQIELRAGNASTGYTDIRENKNADGSSTLWGTNKANGNYEQVKGAPNIPAQTPQDAGSHPAIPTQDGRMMVWDPSADNGRGGKGTYVDSGAPANTTAAAKANADLGAVQATIGKTSADTALTQGQLDALKLKTPAEVAQLEASGALSKAQADQIYQMLPGAIASQTATTAHTTAETGQITTATQIAQQKAGPEINQLNAQAELAKAEAAAQNRPTVIGTPTADDPFIQFVTPDGKVQSQPNRNFAPKDPARAVAQLQDQMTAYAKTLTDQVNGGQISKDQAQAQWNQWYGQNIAPLKSEIQTAQQQQQFTNQISAGTLGTQQQNAASNAQTAATGAYNAQVSAQKTASDIGTAAVNAALARPQGSMQVGPGWGQAMGQITSALQSGKAPGNIDWNSALTFQAPNAAQIYQNATANALKGISPMAAQIAQAPLPQVPAGMDLNSMLSNNMNVYAPGGGAAGGGTGGTTVQNQPYQLGIQQGGNVYSPSAAAQATQPTQPTAATGAPTTSGGLVDVTSPEYGQWLASQIGNYNPGG